MGSNLGYYQDDTSAALTSSYVSYNFGLMAQYLRIDNDDTAGSNRVDFSFDGVNSAGQIIPGKYIEVQAANKGAIFLKYDTGAPAYRLIAMAS